MKTFITFDGATIAYHDEGEGSLLSFCTAMALMALGNSGISSGFSPYLKKDKRFSSKHLGELRRYRILLAMDAAG